MMDSLALVRLGDGAVLATYPIADLTNVVFDDGDGQQGLWVRVGWSADGYMLAPRTIVGSAPSAYATLDNETSIFDGSEVTTTRTWTDHAAPSPDPGTVPPRLIASALSIEVANGDVSAIAGAFNLVAAIYLGVGQFMLLFLTPQPDANYFTVANGSAPNFSVGEQTEDYLIIDASDGGEPCDPSRFNVQIYRMES